MKKFYIFISLAVLLVFSVQAQAITVTISKSQKIGNESVRDFSILFDSSYPTNGEALAASTLQLASVRNLICQPTNGYLLQYDYTNSKIKVYKPTGAQTSAAGASHNHAFTGTSAGSLNLATPAWSGTGLTAAGQAMTTTDNLTMTLNEAAGMWLLPATASTPPMLIVSNTAVTGAPGVLTVIGAAATDAGAYKIVKNIVPVGTNAAEATHTHGIVQDVGDEVTNATDLSAAITAAKCRAIGY